MAKVLHTCTGCVPIDVSIIDTYVALLKMLNAGRGPAGDSAYEVAVKNGFEGTEEEWLESLVGPQGEQGIQGIQGETGPIGPAGINDGPVAVSVGSSTGTPSGTAYVHDGVLSISFNGVKGEQGNSGYSGAAGELEVVNNRYQGGATSAWSAEQGKLLSEETTYIDDAYQAVTIDQSEYTVASYYINSGTGKWSTSVSGKHIMLDVSNAKKIKVVANAEHNAYVIFVSRFMIGDSGKTAPVIGTTLIVSAGKTGYASIPVGAVGAAVTYGTTDETYGWANKPAAIVLYNDRVNVVSEELDTSKTITVSPMYVDRARIADSVIGSDNSTSIIFPVKQGDLLMADFMFTGSAIRYGFCSLPPVGGMGTYMYEETTKADTQIHYSRKAPIDGYYFLCDNVSGTEFTSFSVRIKNEDVGAVVSDESNSRDSINEIFEHISPFSEVDFSELTKRKYRVGRDGLYYSDSARHVVIPVESGGKIKVIKNEDRTFAAICWLTEKGTLGSMNPAPLVPDTYRIQIDTDDATVFDIPEGANYCYVLTLDGGVDYTPEYVGYAKPLSEVLPDNSVPAIFKNNPQDEYEPLMLAARRAHYYSEFLTPAPTTLAWFTDVHGDRVATENVLMWEEKYSTLIDDIIATGDQAETHFYQNFDWWAETGANNILQVIGNHDAWATQSQFKQADYPGLTFNDMVEDTYGSTGNYVIKPRYVYDKYFAPFVSGWNVVQPDNAEANGQCYYYKDYPAIRLIVLDMMHCARGADWDGSTISSSAQLTWFASVLEDARTNNKPVVVATHMSPAFAIDMKYIPCKYNTTKFDGTTTTADATKFAYRYVDDFITAGGEFVCWLVGHSHNDKIYTIKTGTSTEQFVVCLTCASARNPSSIARGSAGIRVVGTKTEDAFNVISFDTARKLIKIVRVGQSISDMMERYQQLTYRYADSTDDYNNPLSKGLVSCD